MTKLFNIYEEEMDGSARLVDTLEASSREEALEIFFKENKISESAKWIFGARLKAEVDKMKADLEETGYDSWEEYYKDMYPERRIEL